MSNEQKRASVFIAVEKSKYETPYDVAKAVIRAGQEKRRLFKELELLDVMSYGGRQFVRFRCDTKAPRTILRHLFTSERRNVVMPAKDGMTFEVWIGTRRGSVSSYQMHEAAKDGYGRILRGPYFKDWTSQFKPKVSLSHPHQQGHDQGRRGSVFAQVQG